MCIEHVLRIGSGQTTECKPTNRDETTFSTILSARYQAAMARTNALALEGSQSILGESMPTPKRQCVPVSEGPETEEIEETDMKEPSSGELKVLGDKN